LGISCYYMYTPIGDMLMTTFNLFSLTGVESSIERLGLPAFHPAAFCIEIRRTQFMLISRAIHDLYDRSVIDSFDYGELSARARHAYIHGGL